MVANLTDTEENGEYSKFIISHLNSYERKCETRIKTREQLFPKPIKLPDDTPSLYRGFIDNVLATLTNESVACRASDELHELLVVWLPPTIMTPRTTSWTCNQLDFLLAQFSRRLQLTTYEAIDKPRS